MSIWCQPWVPIGNAGAPWQQPCLAQAACQSRVRPHKPSHASNAVEKVCPLRRCEALPDGLRVQVAMPAIANFGVGSLRLLAKANDPFSIRLVNRGFGPSRRVSAANRALKGQPNHRETCGITVKRADERR